MKLRNKKTGEIKDVESLGHAESLRRDFGYQVTLSWNIMDNLDKCRTYNTLAELNEEWEDYKPAEPLIKDEKIRKAVRAWAEANNIEDVAHYTFGDEFADFKAWDKFGKECEIMFYHRVELDEARHYTIAELCGEEEE